MQADEGGITVNATYYLKEPTMVTAFEAEMRLKGLNDMLKATTDESEYNSVVGPVMGLKSIAFTFMVIVLILGGIVLILLSSIAIRERKYEIGVLRAMGMKKHKVALGLWTETLAITVICLVVGLAVGTIISQPVSDTLLAGQIESANAAVGDDMTALILSRMSGSGSVVEPLSELNVSLGAVTLLQIIVISLLLASVAGYAAISKITKYEPIKILMERN
jgi:putative ABC transport system permease protein